MKIQRKPTQNTSTDHAEVEHLRGRVRLYLQVLLAIDLLAYLSDFVMPFFIEGLDPPSYPGATATLRYSVTAGTVLAWIITRFVRANRWVMTAMEIGVTLAIVQVYIRIAEGTMTGPDEAYGAVFATFGIIMILSVRAAFVPSSLIRTVAVGGVALASLFISGQNMIRVVAPTVVDGIVFIGAAFVVVTATISRVIYGLRREVRQAQRLGQYTLEEKLGEGGMGSVYRATHAMLRREAAIKLIKPELSGEGDGRARARERFEREADVTASLKSPHTVELYDFGVSADGAFYYVMELLDGIDLQTAVTKYGPMSADRVVFVLMQVCDSLEEAHASGLVHRDIKPANIFLCRYGLRSDFVKVLDFGLVTLDTERAERDPNLTVEGMAVGTPAYIAPELLAGTGSDSVDGRADIYAIGCVAYWLLTGQAPFVRDSVLATALAHLNETPFPPSKVGELEISSELEAVVLSCLEKRPEDRPGSAAELSRRLDEASPRTWGPDEAEKWWDLHRPSRELSSIDQSGGESLLVTKALE